jgi:hypothetical protein
MLDAPSGVANVGREISNREGFRPAVAENHVAVLGR